MIKVKVEKTIGLKTGEKNYENVFLNLDEKRGTEVEIEEKELKYVRDSVKRLLKAQAILQKALERTGE